MNSLEGEMNIILNQDLVEDGENVNASGYTNSFEVGEKPINPYTGKEEAQIINKTQIAAKQGNNSFIDSRQTSI